MKASVGTQRTASPGWLEYDRIAAERRGDFQPKPRGQPDYKDFETWASATIADADANNPGDRHEPGGMFGMDVGKQFSHDRLTATSDCSGDCSGAWARHPPAIPMALRTEALALAGPRA